MRRFSRREVLKLTGLSAAGAFVLQACGFPRTELQVQSPVKMPEDIVTGRDTYYATVCRQCPAGCGTMVRVVEGRAIKIEGNPLHPVNRGKICARGLAAVQALYHPDRLQKPLKRDRSSGRFTEISWNDAAAAVGQQLSQLRSQGQANTLLLATEPLRGYSAYVTTQFVKSYGGQQMAYEAVEQAALRAAVKRAFNTDILPDFDIASSGYVLSFGADFLSSGPSPVHYNMAYGEFRQGARPRGVLVQIDPRFSMTAANADEWVAVQPGTEGILALGIAQVIISEGLADATAIAQLTQGAGAAALADYQPASVSRATGIPEGRIRDIARAFARPPRGGPSIAIGGGPAAAQSNSADTLTAVLLLNYLAGNVGRNGGVLFNPQAPTPALQTVVRASSFQEWQALSNRMATGAPKPVRALLVHNANPAYGLPPQASFLNALDKVPFIVSFATVLDETSSRADIVLPVHEALEEWGADVPEPGPGFQVVSYQQPVVNPTGDTRSFADALLMIGKAIGGDVSAALPWTSSLDWMRSLSDDLRKLGRGSVVASDLPTFWNKLLQAGVWWDEKVPGAAPDKPGASLPKLSSPTFSDNGSGRSYHLIPFPSHSLGDGAGAHLPWLQATPDPLTTVVWRTWIEIGPATAAALSVKEGDIVEVSSVSGKIEGPVYVHLIMPEGIVGVPFGQGHSSYTRYANGLGVNVNAVLAPVLEKETASLAWAATMVGLRPTGRQETVPKFEGGVPALLLQSPTILQVTGPSAQAAPSRSSISVRPASTSGYRWAMAVDLDRCTGCQTCVVACQAENNIPLNSAEWFMQRRAFEWIRIERYWDQAGPEPRARFLPVLCQQCTNAPCEPVCPVYATSHNDEGLNMQVYPRCIGTRFCSNNCPYHARFFNFWPAVWPRSFYNYLNPSVTVRPRGIVEKCTFCVQRINAGTRRAKREGRTAGDGEIVPACAQACPTNALVFGNTLDPQSRVSQLAQGGRGYTLLEDLGTEPGVTYLKKVDIHVA